MRLKGKKLRFGDIGSDYIIYYIFLIE